MKKLLLLLFLIPNLALPTEWDFEKIYYEKLKNCSEQVTPYLYTYSDKSTYIHYRSRKTTIFVGKKLNQNCLIKEFEKFYKNPENQNRKSCHPAEEYPDCNYHVWPVDEIEFGVQKYQGKNVVDSYKEITSLSKYGCGVRGCSMDDDLIILDKNNFYFILDYNFNGISAELKQVGNSKVIYFDRFTSPKAFFNITTKKFTTILE